MRKLTVILFVQMLVCFCFAQEKLILSGNVTDADSGEKILGANVFVKRISIGTTTNDYGYYSLQLEPGIYEIEISYVGYEVHVEHVVLSGNLWLSFELPPASYTLGEVRVTTNQERLNVRRPQMSVSTITVNTIKDIPVILGEADIIKSLLQLPGITNAGEGTDGFNVRGGAADQNLILLDGATLYSASHLFGFFSIFNPDAIRSVKIYKGGIPSRYGNRVSSVLDIYQKDGNRNKFKVTGGVGAIASRLLVEGPIVKGRSSFLFGGRSSYAHLFLKFSDNDNSAYFYDLNTKFNYQVNDNNSLHLSGYFGRDVFSLSGNIENTFGNTLGNLRWNHLFSEKLFSNLSFIYSDYHYGLLLDFVGFEWESGIQNFNLKYDFNHYVNEFLTFNYGLQGTYNKFQPGKISPSNTASTIKENKVPPKYAAETDIYFDVEQQISPSFSVSYGVRYSYFWRLGNETVRLYRNNEAVVFNKALQLYEKAIPRARKEYSLGETIKTYGNIEPRIVAAYFLSDNSSLKFCYSRMVQYMHLISNTTAPMPLDVWTPSGKYIEPQLADQYAIGYAANFHQRMYSIEIEGYYKSLKDRMAYIDGADLIGNKAIEQVILPAEGRAYGLEVYLKKNKGNFTGWLSYTLGRSELRVQPRKNLETGINKGEWYRTDYDKTHDFSLTGMYKLSDKWRLSASFILQSGRPTTYPKAKYQYGDLEIPNYGLRNEDELPAYHRLDIAAILTPDSGKRKGWQGEWIFGVYNIYNRKNARNITFRQNYETGDNEAVKLSIFGIVPSVTYNFKF